MRMKSAFVVFAATLLAVGMLSTTQAFHDGGVAECIGCHSMHTPDPAGYSLLNNQDASSTCLDCHIADAGFEVGSSYHIATAEALMPAGTAPGNLTPGGDFGWIKKDYTWTVPWGSQSEDGDTHGHNIIAGGYSYAADSRPENATAPGGTYPNSQLACSSCHDPHGRYRRLEDGTIATAGAPTEGSGSYASSHVPGPGEAVGVYRLLAGNGYNTDGVTFTGVPVAVAPDEYNRPEDTTQTRVAYGYNDAGGHVGWADWCGTCHGDFHSSGNYVHPTDDVMSGVVTNYNSYVKTADLTGSSTTSFLSLTPFARGGAAGSDYSALAAQALSDDSDLSGPVGADLVTCLSCHRAHASGFEYAIRWNPESELLTYDGMWPGSDNTAPPQFARGRTEAEMQTAYYERPASTFATYQRSLCNKCHVKD